MLAVRGCGRRFDPRCVAPRLQARNIGSRDQREGLMTLEGLIILLVVGAIAGWLAGVIMKGYGFGLIGNIVVGIVGAVIAGWLLPRLGIAIGGGIIAQIINAL